MRSTTDVSVECRGKRVYDEKQGRRATGSAPGVLRFLFSSLLIIIAAAGQLTQPYAAASPVSGEANWSCPQPAWRECLETRVDPDPPQSESPINFSVHALKTDDHIRSAIFHYKWREPFGPWNPPVSYYDVAGTNGSVSQNKDAFVEHPGYLGGFQVEFFWTVYDLKNGGLHTDVESIEVAGNHTWPAACPVPYGFDACVDVEFGYYSGGVQVPLAAGERIPPYQSGYALLRSKRGIPISEATVNYGLYEPGLACGDPSKPVKYGPSSERAIPKLPDRLNISFGGLSSSEPLLDLCFRFTVTDDYGRTLISRVYDLSTSAESPPPHCWTGRLIAVVRWVDELTGRVFPLQGVTVLFRNSTGNTHSNVTDAWGIAYSGFIVVCGSDTWTFTAVYSGYTEAIRERIPSREREASGNYTYHLTFISRAPRAPSQESVDSGYFTWMSLGIIAFIALMAPFAARHFSEKRRREELKRSEKERRFRL